MANILDVIRSIAADLAPEVASGDLEELATKAVDELAESAWREATIQLIISEARHAWRARTLEIERAAQRGRDEQLRAAAAARVEEQDEARIATGGYFHGSTNRRNKCKCEVCARARSEVEEIERQAHERMVTRMARLLDDYESMLRVEWTEELLSAGFALPDGTVTTWGAATIQQHELRVQMLTTNAIANAEAAARHMQAITTIREAGAATLTEAVGSDA